VERAVAGNRVAEIDLDRTMDVLKALDVDLQAFWDEKGLRNRSRSEPSCRIRRLLRSIMPLNSKRSGPQSVAGFG
jgi:hypothetical protein